MKCARCSAEIPSQSQFCLRCGTPISTSQPVAPYVQPYVNPHNPMPFGAPPRTNQRTIALIIAILAIAVVGLGAKVFLFSKPSDSGGTKVVAAPGEGNGGSLVQAPGESNPGAPVQAPAETQAPTLPMAAATAPPFPQDVDDYLKFVKEVERRKQAIIRKQTGDALLMLTQAKALSASIDEQDYTNSFNNMRDTMAHNDQDWQSLASFFNTKAPPPSCVDLRNKYLDHLGKIQSVLFKVNDVLTHLGTDRGAAVRELTDMQGKSSQDADSAAEAADEALADVCSQFHLRKEFDVRTDSGGGGLLQ